MLLRPLCGFGERRRAAGNHLGAPRRARREQAIIEMRGLRPVWQARNDRATSPSWNVAIFTRFGELDHPSLPDPTILAVIEITDTGLKHRCSRLC